MPLYLEAWTAGALNGGRRHNSARPCGPTVGYLYRLRERMTRVGFSQAYNAMHALFVDLACEVGGRRLKRFPPTDK
jgi:hypothetical protein